MLYFILVKDLVAVILLYILGILYFTKYTIPNKIIKIVSPTWNEWLLMHKRIINILIPVFFFAMALWLTFGLLLPVIKDIPYDIAGKYCKIEGVVLNDSLERQPKGAHERHVRIKSDSGEVVRITTIDVGIHEGEYLVAYYYPNSKIAPIVERIDISNQE